MKICQALGCTKPIRKQKGEQKYCSMHLSRLKRNGHLGLKTGPHKLEKLSHDIDHIILENSSKPDKELLGLIIAAGCVNATVHNVKYRRRKLGIRKYYGNCSKHLAKRKAINAYGKACEICGYDLVVDVHHILEKSNGGNHEIENLVIVCPNCHALITRRILSIKSRDDIPLLKQKIGELR